MQSKSKIQPQPFKCINESSTWNTLVQDVLILRMMNLDFQIQRIFGMKRCLLKFERTTFAMGQNLSMEVNI